MIALGGAGLVMQVMRDGVLLPWSDLSTRSLFSWIGQQIGVPALLTWLSISV